MYVSTLIANTSGSPGYYAKPGQTWMRDVHEVHRRLSMAFCPRPKDDKGNSPQRSFGDHDFLFAVDRQPGGIAAIVVQSAAKPNWERAFFRNEHLLAAPVDVRQRNYQIAQGQHYRYRLCMHPTKRNLFNGCRVPLLRNADQSQDAIVRTWLDKKANACGFKIDTMSLSEVQNLSGTKRTNKCRIDIMAATAYGILTVTDVDKFSNSLISGIGSGKAYGCGMLRVALIDNQ